MSGKKTRESKARQISLDAYRAGYRVSYYNTGECCEYNTELAVDWHDGFQDGMNDRLNDDENGGPYIRGIHEE